VLSSVAVLKCTSDNPWYWGSVANEKPATACFPSKIVFWGLASRGTGVVSFGVLGVVFKFETLFWVVKAAWACCVGVGVFRAFEPGVSRAVLSCLEFSVAALSVTGWLFEGCKEVSVAVLFVTGWLFEGCKVVSALEKLSAAWDGKIVCFDSMFIAFCAGPVSAANQIPKIAAPAIPMGNSQKSNFLRFRFPSSRATLSQTKAGGGGAASYSRSRSRSSIFFGVRSIFIINMIPEGWGFVVR